MQHERLEPGAHLRKNQKQILAMLRASTQRAGLEWDFVQETGSVGRGRILRGAGGAELGQARVEFTTDGVKFEGAPTGGETRSALALYTDTRWLMETFEGLLVESGR
jgi:hypothetical protein